MTITAVARIFRITVDGLTRTYRLTAESASELAAAIQAKSPRSEVAVRDTQRSPIRTNDGGMPPGTR
jgi:hypothetical protein